MKSTPKLLITKNLSHPAGINIDKNSAFSKGFFGSHTLKSPAANDEINRILSLARLNNYLLLKTDDIIKGKILLSFLRSRLDGGGE